VTHSTTVRVWIPEWVSQREKNGAEASLTTLTIPCVAVCYAQYSADLQRLKAGLVSRHD